MEQAPDYETDRCCAKPDHTICSPERRGNTYEAKRGPDAESAAAKERAFIEATRPTRNDLGSHPVGSSTLFLQETG
jgi:hypothetical protein